MRSVSKGLLAVPILGMLAFLFFIPLVITFIYSVHPQYTYHLTFDLTLENYYSAVIPLLPTYAITILYSAAVTLITIGIAFPTAYILAKKYARYAWPLIIIIVSPLFITLVIRNLGWQIFLLTAQAAFPGIPKLLYTPWGSLLGVFYIYFPYMLFCIYLSMNNIDDNIITAARALGAGRLALIREILIPLNKPGILIGTLFVFILSLGARVPYRLIGGLNPMPIAEEIYYAFGWGQNWPLGSAISSIMILISLIFVIVVTKVVDVDRLIKGFWRMR